MLNPFHRSKALIFFKIILIAFILMVTSSPHIALGQGGLNEITSLSYSDIDTKAEIRIKGVTKFVSTVYELPKPQRIIVDIADAKIAKDFAASNSIPIKFTHTEVQGSNPSITRFEFFIENFDSFSHSSENNELTVTIKTSLSLAGSPKIDDPTHKSAPINLEGIQVNKEPNKTQIHIKTNSKVDKFTTDIITKNSKQNLDVFIDNSDTSKNNLGSIDVNTQISKVVTARKDSGILISLVSSTDKIFKHTINDDNSGILITVDEQDGHNQLSKITNHKTNVASQLPEINPLDSKISPQGREQQMQDAFNFSGYNKDRITVEFQKMDLHNVFNFLRQVSGVNIVVDESVEGSLTLVLDAVPWDFALDIILNLKGLEKEERFNTIVIYPKGKGFSWPEKAENNLSFETDSTVIAKEALIVQQQDKQSPEIVESKEIIAKAVIAERAENFESAVSLYERAFDKWPANAHLANKISALYLIYLRQNAKSLYFAQRALSAEPNNQDALLHAGIASANMQNTLQAEQYFTQAVRGKKPSKEALLNYAAFKEEKKDYRESLTLLTQHDQHFGKSFDSMIATARINDKMGNNDIAKRQYREILNSGFQVPPDLAKFIQERITQ